MVQNLRFLHKGGMSSSSRTRSIRDSVLSLKNVYLGPFIRLLRVTGYKEHLSINWISNCP